MERWEIGDADRNRELLGPVDLEVPREVIWERGNEERFTERWMLIGLPHAGSSGSTDGLVILMLPICNGYLTLLYTRAEAIGIKNLLAGCSQFLQGFSSDLKLNPYHRSLLAKRF